jgi:serine/threonine-protein kinase HipA
MATLTNWKPSSQPHCSINFRAAGNDSPTGLHGVFEDSLPDAWGQALLYRRHNVPRQQRRAAYLLDLLGVEAMGALAYTPKPVLRDEHQIAELPDLADLLSAAAQYEGEPDAPFDEMMPLFVAGSIQRADRQYRRPFEELLHDA